MKLKLLLAILITLVTPLIINHTAYGYPRGVSMQEYRAVEKDDYYTTNLTQEIKDKALDLKTDIFDKKNSYLSYNYNNKQERKLYLQALFVLESSYFYYEYMPYSEGKSTSGETGVIYINASKARAIHNRNIYLRKEIKKIAKKLKINRWTSERLAVKKINNYICDNFDYDYTFKNRTAYEMIKNKTGVCSAYAELFRILCNYYGLQVEDVVGNNGSHEWSRVKIYGKWKYTDVTWNDELGRNKYLSQSKKFFYKNNKHKNTYIQKLQKAKPIIWLDQ